ncbi:hypothetical protein GCM10023172_20240 [Hymenobacter ginsengisoli]|uniref:ADP-heptose--LPS heptosyltransferase n=2 Tax=Hymenobacteraceae TaxID=1853232 RepID=A0ABP8QB22_9BACT
MLVVRNDSIGDYLLYRPWLRQMAAVMKHRGQHLTLLANSLWAPLAQLWDSDILTEVIAVDFGRFSKDLAYRVKILQAVGGLGVAEAIYPVHVRQAAVENFIRFLRAPVRVGSQGSHPTGEWYAALDAGYTRLLPTTREVLFEYYRNREFFLHWQTLSDESTGVASSVEVAVAPLTLPATVRQQATVMAASIGKPYVVLFPGASARQKRWPTGHFGRLAKYLHQYYGGKYQLVLAGSAADSVLARRVQRAAGTAVPLLNYCGKTDLPGLAALIAGAQALISNDTVAAHLGAQAGTPCVVILMGENYGKFFPYPPELLQTPCYCLFPPSQETRFARGDFTHPSQDPDLSEIDISRVVSAVIELLTPSIA